MKNQFQFKQNFLFKNSDRNNYIIKQLKLLHQAMLLPISEGYIYENYW